MSNSVQTAAQNQSKAEELKAQGNALHLKKDFPSAYKKYTEAIEEDDTNPIFYSNRAASSLVMNE
jgi:hypothetical protein